MLDHEKHLELIRQLKELVRVNQAIVDDSQRLISAAQKLIEEFKASHEVTEEKPRAE